MTEPRLAPGWDATREILCVRLDALGDVLMTTPAIRALKVGSPDSRITLLASPAGAPAGRMMPFVDRVIPYEAPWMKATARRRSAASDRALVEELRQGRFDAAVIFTVHSQSPLPAALATYLADIPLRLAHCRENPYELLSHWVPDPEADEPNRHEVSRQLALVESVGYAPDGEHLSIRVPPGAARRIRGMLATIDITGERWLVVHPGASAPSRRYPADSFAAAIRSLARDKGWRVVLTGSADEAPLTAEVARLAGPGLDVVDLAGRLDVGQLAALLARAPVLVSNNTGVAHVAAAVGTPVVVLYALTNPQHAPWGVPSRLLYNDVPCRWCRKSVCPFAHHACLRGVEPERIVTAVDEVVAEWGSWRGILDPPIRPAFPAVMPLVELRTPSASAPPVGPPP
jgi:lipopolysaccharide heptosyltransferase II